MTEQLILKGTLEGHSGWVTSLATSLENPNMLLSGSRDKTLIIWNLTRDESSYGYPKRSLHGHSHIVSDCVCLPGGIVASRRCIFYTETESRSSPLTEPMHSLPPGTRLSASGSLLLVPLPEDLLDTRMMFSPSLSPPITDKLSPDLAIEPLSSGTLSVTASLPSLRRDTATGSRV